MFIGKFMPSTLAMVHVRQSAVLKGTQGWGLLDGQTRLKAIAKMPDDYSCEFYVTIFRVENDTEYQELFDMFDQIGKIRNLQDTVEIECKRLGLAKNPSGWRHIVSALFTYHVELKGHSRKEDQYSKLDRAQLLRKYAADRDLLYAIFYMRTLGMSRAVSEKLRKANIMVAYLLAREESPAKAEAFFSRLLSEASDGSAMDRVPRECRERLLKIDMGHGQARIKKADHCYGTPTESFDTVMLYWTAFAKGRYTFTRKEPPFLDPKFKRSWLSLVPRENREVAARNAKINKTVAK
jgi:hypothetical protein